MAQQGSVSESHGSWYVRWWEKIQQKDGSFEWVHPSHRLASKRDYPKKSEVMPLAKEFMDRVNRTAKSSSLFDSCSTLSNQRMLPAGCSRIRLAGRWIWTTSPNE